MKRTKKPSASSMEKAQQLGGFKQGIKIKPNKLVDKII